MKINQIAVDATTLDSFYDKIKHDILIEIEIIPNQVSDFKVEYHKAFLKKWITETNQNNTFEEIWEIREQCISKLSE